MIRLYWSFESEAARDAGAIPPEALQMPYGKRSADSPFRSREFESRWRALEAGYRVQPADCPPVRAIAGYGLGVRCPGLVQYARRREWADERAIDDERAAFGIVEVRGDRWPGTDSGFIASWIAGSEFVKIHSGILVHFPQDMFLYQGPLPNAALIDAPCQVMAGLEYAVSSTSIAIDGVMHGSASLNVIARLPPGGVEVRIDKGQLIGWAFAVPKSQSLLRKPIDPS